MVGAVGLRRCRVVGLCVVCCCLSWCVFAGVAAVCRVIVCRFVRYVFSCSRLAVIVCAVGRRGGLYGPRFVAYFGRCVMYGGCGWAYGPYRIGKGSYTTARIRSV